MIDLVSIPHDPTPEMQTVGAGELARLAESGLDDREICDVIYRAMVDEFLYPATPATEPERSTVSGHDGRASEASAGSSAGEPRATQHRRSITTSASGMGDGA